MKYIFKWYYTDGYTYGYDEIIPFECDDLDEFLYKAIRKVEKSDLVTTVLGVPIYKEDLPKLENCFFSLEEWFDKNKIEEL